MKKICTLVLVLVLLSSIISGFSLASSPSTWAQEDVETVKLSGYFENHRFNQYQRPITRLEFIYFSSRLFEILSGSEIVVGSSKSFIDTSHVWALKGATVGISDGVGNGLFNPDGEVTREQLATMLIRTLQLGNLSLSKPGRYRYSDDATISDWAKESMYIARENGILSGIGNDMADPKGYATVEQIMVIVNRILTSNQGKSFTYNGKTNIIPYNLGSTTDESISWDRGTYIGELKNQIPHGHGEMIWPAGNKYIGNWKDGEMHGHGTYIWADKSIYVGEWEGGLRHGNGTMSWPGGKTYTGAWIEGFRNGYGTMTWSDGIKYQGEWKDNSLHGKGTVFLDNGIKFVGEWENNLVVGEGVYILPDGRVVPGQWLNGFFAH